MKAASTRSAFPVAGLGVSLLALCSILFAPGSLANTEQGALAAQREGSAPGTSELRQMPAIPFDYALEKSAVLAQVKRQKKNLLCLGVASAAALAGLLAIGILLSLRAAGRARVPAGEEPETRPDRSRPRMIGGVLLVFAAGSVAALGSRHFRAEMQNIESAGQNAIQKLQETEKVRQRWEAERRKVLHRRTTPLAGLRRWSASRVVWGTLLAALPEHVPPEIQLLILGAQSPVEPQTKGKTRVPTFTLKGKSGSQTPIDRLGTALKTKEPFLSGITNVQVDVGRDPSAGTAPGDLLFTFTADCRLPRAEANADRLGGFEALPRLERELRLISNRYTLHPVMGVNYRIPADRAIQRRAVGSGVKTCRMGSGQLSKFPAVEGSVVPSPLDVFTCSVEVQGSFEQLGLFVALLEDGDSRSSIARVSIAAQARDPGVHYGNLLLAWPAWNQHARGLDFSRGGAGEPGEERPAPTDSTRLEEIRKKLGSLSDPFHPRCTGGFRHDCREHTPSPTPKPNPVKDWDRVQSAIQLAGLIGTGDKTTAVVKMRGVSGTRMVNVGEMFEIQSGGILYQWRITSISEDGLGLERVSAKDVRETRKGKP